jgi:hypothetical protein
MKRCRRLSVQMNASLMDEVYACEQCHAGDRLGFTRRPIAMPRNQQPGGRRSTVAARPVPDSPGHETRDGLVTACLAERSSDAGIGEHAVRRQGDRRLKVASEVKALVPKMEAVGARRAQIMGAVGGPQGSACGRSAIVASRQRLRRYCRLRHAGWSWRRM